MIDNILTYCRITALERSSHGCCDCGAARGHLGLWYCEDGHADGCFGWRFWEPLTDVNLRIFRFVSPQKTSWWQLKYFLEFSPLLPLGKIPDSHFDEHIFQMGWVKPPPTKKHTSKMVGNNDDLFSKKKNLQPADDDRIGGWFVRFWTLRIESCFRPGSKENICIFFFGSRIFFKKKRAPERMYQCGSFKYFSEFFNFIFFGRFPFYRPFFSILVWNHHLQL